MIAMTLLCACATAGSEQGACPPVMEYTAEEQWRAATEVEALQQGSAVLSMMLDHNVLRQQSQVCQLEQSGMK